MAFVPSPRLSRLGARAQLTVIDGNCPLAKACACPTLAAMQHPRPLLRPHLVAPLLLAAILGGCGVESSQPVAASAEDPQWGHLEPDPDQAQQARADEGAQGPTSPTV
jgi:hypothetical protein